MSMCGVDLIAMVGAALFCVIMVLTILVACGMPLGEFTMGGRFKILPKKLRILAFISVAIQLMAIFIILQSAGILSLWFSHKTTKVICICYAVYLTLNVFMNACSNSRKEKYVMTPTSLLAAICFWITGISM